MTAKELGTEIARVRKSKNITQAELSKRVGLTRSKLGRIENGQVTITWGDANILMEAMGAKLPEFSLDGQAIKTEDYGSEKLIIAVVDWLATSKNISYAEALTLMRAYKALDFLVINYCYEQALPKETILEDVLAVCRQNGSEL